MRPGHARGPDRRVVAGRRRATGRCGAGGIRLGPRRIAATATTGEPVGTRLPPPTDGAEDARRAATRAALRSIGRTPDEIAAMASEVGEALTVTAREAVLVVEAGE